MAPSSMFVFGFALLSLAAVISAQTIVDCPALPKGCKNTTCDALTTKSTTVGRGYFYASNIPNMGAAAGITIAACCNLCRITHLCRFWEYHSVGSTTFASLCFLYPNLALKPKCYDFRFQLDALIPLISYVGGFCNPDLHDDPHLVGAQGTRFDFSGLPDKAFALISDQRLAVNILLRGYLDSRNESATSFVNGKAIRTWVREFAVLWHDGRIEHKVRFTARNGANPERAQGFLAGVEADGRMQTLPKKVDDSLVLPGGFTLTMTGIEKYGTRDVDAYLLTIDGLLTMTVRMQVAHRLLRTATEAEAHFNLGVKTIEATDDVHGILGQTFRADHVRRAAEYTALSNLIHAPIVVEAESGKGFLDGEPVKDYMLTDILSADCTFSRYAPPVLPLPGVSSS